MRPVTKSIVVIDDLANRTHDCNLLVDATFGRKEEDYEGLVPPDALSIDGYPLRIASPVISSLSPPSIGAATKHIGYRTDPGVFRTNGYWRDNSACCFRAHGPGTAVRDRRGPSAQTP